MTKVNLNRYIRHVLNTSPTRRGSGKLPFCPVAMIVCPGCLGRGRYIGFRRVEDPCEVCGGSGESVPKNTGLDDMCESPAL